MDHLNQQIHFIAYTSPILIITGGEKLSEFGLHVTINDKEIIPHLLTSRLLMYYPWETDTKVSVWYNPPEEVIPM